MDNTKNTRRVIVQHPDPMRHFSREGPVVKLVALLICKLPALSFAAFGAFMLVGRALG